MTKLHKIVILFIIGVFSLAIFGASSVQAAFPFQDEGDGEETGSFFCESPEELHPAGAGLAEFYDVSYGEIMDAFCAGNGFGTIGLALETANLTGESWGDLLALAGEDGWGQVWQELDLIGRPEDAGPPNDEDGDGIPDFAGPPNDNDGDGRPDFAGPPNDLDGDGRPDHAGPPNDHDGDGRPDHAGPWKLFRGKGRPGRRGPWKGFDGDGRPDHAGPYDDDQP